MVKSLFEQWIWDQVATEVSHYYDDNGIFTNADYQQDSKKRRRLKYFLEFVSRNITHNLNVPYKL